MSLPARIRAGQVVRPRRRAALEAVSPPVRPAPALAPYLRAAGTLAVAAATVALVLGGLCAAYDYAVANPRLAVERIEVRGNRVYRPEEVAARASLAKGEAILNLDLAAIEARLEADPRIARAVVRRILPDAVEVEVVERRPIARLRIGGEMYGVDAEGVPFPLIPSAEDVAFPALSLERLSPKAGEALPREVAGAALDAAAALPEDLAGRVSEIRVEADGGVILVLANGPTVRLGKQDLERRIGELAELLERPEAASASWIDLRFARPIVRR